MTTIEIPVYTVTDGRYIKTYCKSCKPAGSKPGTLVTGSYDHFCCGCGEDFKEIAERKEVSNECTHHYN